MPPNRQVPPEAPTIPIEDASGRDGKTHITVNAAASIDVGSVLAARYQLIELIDEGGMSRVYKGVDLKARTADAGVEPVPIAVKVLTQPFIGTADRFAALSAQVGRWRRLVHPNIVRVFDCERDGAVVFITMEYLAGETVYSKLHRTRADGSLAPLDGQESRRIIASVARALDYAHQRGVVHGDIKPGNVIVTERLEVKVIDFGMARWLARPNASYQGVQYTAASAATPRYASPQLLAGEEPKRSDDVFGLACFAYEILTGVHPFEVAAGARTFELPPPQRPTLTAGEYQALVRALQMERGHRTATIREFTREFAGPPRRSLAALWPLWGGGAALAVLAGWYFWPPPKPSVPVRPPAAATQPAPSSAPASVAEQPGAVIRDCPTCPSMTVLPPGQFRQGAADDERDALAYEKPQHLVNIHYSFAMSTSDITVGDFRQFVSAVGRNMQGCDTYDGVWRHHASASWESPEFAQSARHPVTCISWRDAVAFAEWLSGKTGHGYRLPSASEWEYAARAGGETVRPWSNAGDACAHANVADRSAERRYPGWKVFPCDDGYVNTAPAGTFKANAFGLRDMLGNVLVWTQDCWRPDYSRAPSDGSARLDGNCREHELRGASWFSSPSVVKASYRNHFAAGYRTSSVGFRVVRDLDSRSPAVVQGAGGNIDGHE
jgi:formylglycine-generating enzyme required for sulfatase activity